ncbi:MAG: YiiX/YebB-like N1pC/P60 family cysteine hydrolase [Planctomycetota bacterium]
MAKLQSAIVMVCLISLHSGLAGCASPGINADQGAPELLTEYTPQVGDVIFQSSPESPLINMIEGASNSHYSHCGIVDRRNGRWVVYEAAKQVAATPLETFTNRGRGGGFAVYRFKQPYQAQIPEVIENTRAYLSRPYDFRYRLDEEHIYCSELIYKAFEQATGEPLGELVRLGDLDWQPFEGLINELEQGPPPLDRLIITPIDLALAVQFEVVYARDFEVTRR